MKKLLILAVFSVGCTFGKGFETSQKLSSSGGPGASDAPSYTPTNLTKALSAASKTLMQRLPTADESARAAQGVTQYEAVIREYVNSADFLRTMQSYHNDLFEMSGPGTGALQGINLDEPTNLILYIIQNNRDYREALTATYCVNNTGTNGAITLEQTPRCSTFASDADAQAQAAGVITTQGFLKKWIGPHSFRRVKKSFMLFACSEYPDGSDPGMTAEEIGSVAKGSTAEFNATTGSPVCFNCHSSVNARAALFLNFDRNGLFVATPMGQRFPSNTVPTEVMGRNSKIEDLLKRPDGTIPVPRYHGVEVNKVQEYATLFANGPAFKKCTAQRFFNFMLGREHKTVLPAEAEYLEQVVEGGGYNIRELIVQISKSMAYVNR